MWSFVNTTNFEGTKNETKTVNMSRAVPPIILRNEPAFLPEHKTRDDVELTWKSSTSLTMIVPITQNAEFNLIHL